ncbi:oxidoreductase [compost metagenome]
MFAATSPLLAGIGGVYLKDNDISPLNDDLKPMSALEPPSEIMSHAIDPQSARRLWELSAQMLAAPATTGE